MEKHKIGFQQGLLISITLIVAIGLTPFAIYRIIQESWLIALLDLSLVTIALFIAFYIRKTGNVDRGGEILAYSTITGISLSMYVNGAQHAFWYFPLIVAMFLAFKLRKALFMTSLLATSILALLIEQMEFIEFSTLFFTLILTALFSLLFARKMLSQQQRIIASNQITSLRNKTLETIVSEVDLKHVLTSINRSVEAEFPEMLCSILLLDESGKHLQIGAAESLPNSYNQAIHGIEIGKGVGSCGTAAYTGKRVVAEDIQTHEYWQPYKDLAKEANLGSCWSEPIKDAEGKVLGTFAIYHKDRCTPNQRDFELISQFAHLASISITRERANTIIWHQAHFDQLTGLPNRNMMIEHLLQSIKQARRGNQKVALAFLDLDNFKDINDTLGHSAGDDLLKLVAQRISKAVRDVDLISRIGGDEFVIVFGQIHEPTVLNPVIGRLIDDIAKPYLLKEGTVHTSASIGITLFPDDSEAVESLLKNADQAMYQAKNSGRNCFRFFDTEMRAKADYRAQLIQDLRTALSDNQIMVNYQPIKCLSSNKIMKAEALMRWKHPEKGFISPVEFIPLAEETGLIIELSNYLFERVLDDLSQLQKLFGEEFKLSVNTSPLQYKANTGNINHWLTLVDESEILPSSLVFEITENLLMESKIDITENLIRVRSANINLSIDDFGTGYSSFSYLREYATDYVKIDRSFVQKMTANTSDAALCEAIIVMAKKLNIAVVAEGIETNEQQQLLTKFGCHYGQGYYIAKPMPYDELLSYLDDNPKD